MRAAPPVSVRGTGGRPWRAVQTLLFALANAAPVAWLSLVSELTPSLSLALALAAAAVAAAVAWRLCAPTAFELRWDGQQWQVDSVSGSLDVMMDLDGWLLLRLHPQDSARARWLPLSAREAGPHLHALRAAAYAGVTPAATITAPSAAR